MSSSPQETDQSGHMSRRDFLTFSVVAAGTGAMAAILPHMPNRREKPQARIEQNLALDDEIISTGRVGIHASRIPGILDIHEKGIGLINNLVLLARFKRNGGTHFNNAEIQGGSGKNPHVLRVFKEAARPHEALLVYTFVKDETRPVFHPAANIQMTIRLSATPSGELTFATEHIDHTQPDSHSSDIYLGLGSFFGIYYQTATVEVQTLDTATPTEIPLQKPQNAEEQGNETLGHFDTIAKATGLRMTSYKPYFPAVSLRMKTTFADALAGTSGAATIETRSAVWNESQMPLWEQMRHTSGKEYWFESAILWQSSSLPAWILGVTDSQG